MKFPEIDRNLAQRQLALLGHNINKPVYLRFFYPSDDPRKDGDKGRKADRINWKEIEAYQQQGRGAYVVVNGGGHKNSDVTQGTAIFIEHDDLEKDIQRELWKTLELAEPTFQVDTGGKSIHSYWVFDEPVAIEKWSQLQRDLLEYADGDRSIKNPARVMRLAGGWHISYDENGNPIYNQTKIISASAKTYSFEELREIIPDQKERLPLVEAANHRDFVNNVSDNLSTSSLPRHPDQIRIPVPAPVPLLQCCRKEVRDWVATGVPKGCKRNDTAINVGLELIAVEGYLQTIGQSYSDSAAGLFNEFCQRSGMTASEEAERYQWCQKTNSDPSCPPEAIEACIRGWYWKEVVQPQRPRNNTQYNPQQQGTANNKDSEEKPKINLLDAVKKILTEFPQDSLQHIALMNLSAQTGYAYRELERLARTIEREETLDEETAEAIASLGSNLNLHCSRLDISKYLESNFAALMLDAANAIPTAPEYLFNTVLPAVASRGGTSSRIVANPSGGYVQPLIFWTGNVAHSGQAKTPPQQIVIQPLLDLEEDGNQQYELEQHIYEHDKSGEMDAPTRKRYVLSDTTLSTKVRIHAENKRGLLEYIDELASDYRRLNQFKKGQGDDREQELALFNGGHVSYDRSDTRLFIRRTALSKTGSIQWDTLAQLMNNEGFVESGYMARFLLCSIGEAPPRLLNLLSENDGVQKFQKALRSLYEQMGKLPKQDYLLDYDAKVLFQAWNHTLVDATRRESNFGFSLVYAKIETYTLRVALWLHLVNSLLRGEKPKLVVNGQTMKDAIEITSFYLGQQKLIWAHNDPHNKLEGMLLKIHTSAREFYQQTKKGVSASWAKQKFNALKKIATDKIRHKYFQVLASCGYGELQGSGKSMRYVPYQERLVINGLNESKKLGENNMLGENLGASPSSVTNIQSAFQEKVGEVDDLTYLKIFELIDVENKKQEYVNSTCSNEPIKDHQNTNKSDTNLDATSILDIDDPPQTPHQPPNINADIEWLLKVLDDLENNSRHYTTSEQDSLLSEVSAKTDLHDETLRAICPDYGDRFIAALDKATETAPPTLDELKSLLLACQSWVQLKQVQKQHPEQAKAAYTDMDSDKQRQIDAIAATEVNQEVYKYVGPQRKVDGVEIQPGTLVYLDPQSGNKNRPHLKVRLLQGINQGWQKVVEISRDALQAVEKAVNDGLDVIEGQQSNLLDELS
ncbi:DUF3987 domain-containing protein [Crocosphaera chwakensis]|uniref:DNA primase/polymerase bifunctional N-terminal domain-containing protein n=1 Tax=Crocosphaera chwakensis CCY0110 TaxID=391612 RepID=A3IWG2_9CHRO|nr:DUF3987 domain-containing protein [Crocosphaera chwakensis]EAZ89146.1 hypothetical protein CY0110_31630 [Crocosphaera chwakensis CCY0110]